jgi:hypothetical protein
MARVEFPREESRGRLQDFVRLSKITILFLQPADLFQLRAGRSWLRPGIDLRLPDPLPQCFRAHVQLLAQIPACSPRGRVIRQTIQSHPGRTLTNLEGIFDGHNRILSKKENGTKPGTVQSPFSLVENLATLLLRLFCRVLCVGQAGRVDASVFQPVGGAFEGDDFGVVNDPVDHRGGDDLVAEDVSPAGEWQVAGED